MRYSKHRPPTINTGSMADIAFLLLIFFLVTAVIPNDYGFNRKLPEPCKSEPCSVEQHRHNVLQILVGKDNTLMVNNALISIDELKDQVKRFIDNNGDKSCTYCNGDQLESASDNPTKAVISLQTDRDSTYEFFIEIQDEITKAYYELRENYANEVFKKEINALSKDEIKKLREAYPFILSEAETKTN